MFQKEIDLGFGSFFFHFQAAKINGVHLLKINFFVEFFVKKVFGFVGANKGVLVLGVDQAPAGAVFLAFDFGEYRDFIAL